MLVKSIHLISIILIMERKLRLFVNIFRKTIYTNMFNIKIQKVPAFQVYVRSVWNIGVNVNLFMNKNCMIKIKYVAKKGLTNFIYNDFIKKFFNFDEKLVNKVYTISNLKKIYQRNTLYLSLSVIDKYMIVIFFHLILFICKISYQYQCHLNKIKV